MPADGHTDAESGGRNTLKKTMITVLKFILFFVGWAITASFLPLLNTERQALWRLWAEITPLFAVVVFTFIFWLIEKRSVRLHLLCSPAKSILIGCVGGGLWICAAVILMRLIGVLHFESVNAVPDLPIWIAAAFLNVIMQELLVRGYLYQMLKQKHNTAAAVVVTTGLFVALHGGAFEAGIVPVLNVLSMSLLMTIVLEYTGGLIAPIIMHAIWNIAGAVILGGVSLADDYPHLINSSFSGGKLLSGGDCRIEGSIIVLIWNVLLISFFLWRRKPGFDKSRFYLRA